jgi:YVTN family beta-propeller protein
MSHLQAFRRSLLCVKVRFTVHHSIFIRNFGSRPHCLHGILDRPRLRSANSIRKRDWFFAIAGVGALLLGQPGLAPARAQEFGLAKTIHVGKTPQYAILTPDGRELWVADNGADTLTVIDTASAEVTATIKVGTLPHSLVITGDGSRVYVLVEDTEFENGAPHSAGVAIVDAIRKSVIRHIRVPGRTDELVLTHDDRLLYMTRVYNGVFAFDTQTGELRQVISQTCPIGIALSKDDSRMYVNYQCFGPGGWTAHDAFAAYELPSYKQIAVKTGLANVGGQVVLSPDGSALLTLGFDSCSRPDYDHSGCPSVPSSVVNLLRTSDLGLIKSFGFTLEDSEGRISLSPRGEFFIGGGNYLKVVDSQNPESIKRISIASTGDVAFSPDGNIAYATAADKNVVDVLVRGKPSVPDLQNEASALTISAIKENLLRPHCADQGCSSKGGGFVVSPRIVTADMVTRGVEQPGQAPAKMSKDDDAYCFIAGRIKAEDDLQTLRDLDSLRKNEEARNFTGKQAEAPNDSVTFQDVTGRLLRSPEDLTKSLGSRAVYLSVMVCPQEVVTVMIRSAAGEAVVKAVVARDENGKPLTRDRLREVATEFQADLKNPCSDPKVNAKALYNILLPKPIQDELNAAQAQLDETGNNKLTLMWELGDQLRYLPMSALYDGTDYLVTRFDSSVLTNPSVLADDLHGDFMAVAAGDSTGNDKLPALPHVKQELDGLFYDKSTQGPSGKIQATILLDDGKQANKGEFSTDNFSKALIDLQNDPRTKLETQRPIIHVASHFLLGDTPDSSFLLTESGELTLGELRNQRKKYPLGNTWLVTLSACETAGIRPANASSPNQAGTPDGHEVEGMAYLADQIGAHAVLASLWEIDDTSTSKLMNLFYQGVQQKETKAEALRQAQLQLLDGNVPRELDTEFHASQICDAKYNPPDSFKHPNYWAPFILIGNWH